MNYTLNDLVDVKVDWRSPPRNEGIDPRTGCVVMSAGKWAEVTISISGPKDSELVSLAWAIGRTLAAFSYAAKKEPKPQGFEQ